jgi:hypothetical protein
LDQLSQARRLRGSHRQEHLDRIEKARAEAGYV